MAFDLKDYVEVKDRLIKFWEDHPEGRVATSIIKWEAGVVTMKAAVYDDRKDEQPTATGHAYEKEDSTFINKTSAVENCETSALGRALALRGYEVKKSIASKEEVANARENQDKPKSKPTGNKNKPVTEGQIRRMYAMMKEAGADFDKWDAKIKKKFGIETKNEMTMEQIDKVFDSLEEIIKKNSQEA